MRILGIDIGGSGIKGAPVNAQTGEMLADRLRLPTPRPARPRPVAEVVGHIAREFDWDGPIGCGFPSAVLNGVPMTASNVHKSWIGTDANALFGKATGCATRVINDADAAGLAEMRFGAGKGQQGVVLVITIGTGLGTALFTNGHLVPNMELGHIEMRGVAAEKRASDAVRQRKKLSWKKWARRFDEYLDAMEKLLWPDLIILGGGASKKADRFLRYLSVRAEVVPAMLGNEAGIIGAVLASAPGV